MHYKTVWINGKQKRLHRYLVEQKMGRCLGFNEIVHHKDGNILNNKMDNLELITRSEHLAAHPEINKAAVKTIKKYNLDHDEIKKLYVDAGLSTAKISRLIDVPVYTINWFVRKHEIQHKKDKVICSSCGGKARYKNPPLCNKCYQKRYSRARKGGLQRDAI